MDSIPIITTDRLVLRQIKQSDLQNLVKHLNDQSISDNLFNIPYPYTEQDGRNRMDVIFQGIENNNRFIYAIVWKATDELIGEIGLNKDMNHNNAELGYWIAAAYRGKGIATEVVGFALRFGFESLALQKIYATHFLENLSSATVMKKNGMIKEAEFKDHYFFKGTYRSAHQYRLTKDEYYNARL